MQTSLEPKRLPFPILIPSKGRPKGKLIQELDAFGCDWKVFVEEQDADDYIAELASFEHVEVLPKSNQGISYVRNFIKDYATEREIEWYWMMDDDIEHFYRIENKRAVRADLSVITQAEDYFKDRNDVAQASLDYQQIAWSSDKPFKLNGYNDVCVCINTKRTKGIKYRPEAGYNGFTKEDRDFTLQLLANGWNTLRVEKYAFSCPKNGTNKGGLWDLYQDRTNEEMCSKQMVKLWGPEICKFHVKPDGRPDVKINWGFFKRK